MSLREYFHPPAMAVANGLCGGPGPLLGRDGVHQVIRRHDPQVKGVLMAVRHEMKTMRHGWSIGPTPVDLDDCCRSKP